MKEALFLEQCQLKVSTDPVDLNTAANTGARIDMQKFKRVTFVVIAAAGTTPSAHTVDFDQHDAASAGNSKALSISSPWFHKVDAETAFTKVELSSAVDSIDIDAIVGDTKFVAVFEVLQEELDVNGAFRYVSCNLTDAGGAQLGTVLAICHGATEKPAYSKVV